VNEKFQPWALSHGRLISNILPILPRKTQGPIDIPWLIEVPKNVILGW
jgi:hypothetical protein